jgi:hypothetical protein
MTGGQRASDPGPSAGGLATGTDGERQRLLLAVLLLAAALTPVLFGSLAWAKRVSGGN